MAFDTDDCPQSSPTSSSGEKFEGGGAGAGLDLDRLRQADDLLRRLSEWDMLYVRPDGSGVTADAPYWQREIAYARAALAAAGGGAHE